MYLKRLFIVAALTLALAYVAGAILDKAYKAKWAEIFFKKTDALVKDNSYYDVIFLGDSRVHFGINPYYIDSVANIKSYNFGYGAADAQEIMMTTNIYLSTHPPPKIAVLSLSLGCMTINETLKTRFHDLYYLENDTINKYMTETGFLTGMIKVFPFTRYSFMDEYNRTSLFVKGNPIPRFDHNINKGFVNIHQNTNTDAIYLFNIDSLWLPAVSYFRNTVSAFLQKGVKVVIVAAPEMKNSIYRKTQLRREVDSIFIRVADEHKLNYFHFENDTSLYEDKYFVDDVHLNEPGTRIFSKQLGDSIKAIMPN